MKLRQTRITRRQIYKTGSAFSVGPVTARYLVFALLAVLSLLYLVQTAQGSDKALELRKLDTQRQELDKDLATLEVNATRWQSLQNLSEAAEAQGLVPVEETERLIADE